jgi:streptomycin 6-kinase
VAPGGRHAPGFRTVTVMPGGRMLGVDVASRRNACMHTWQLCDERPLGGGFASAVFACTTAAGDAVVVKLPATRREARAEAFALTAWEHTGAAVQLIDTDFMHGALMLQRIRPGTHLPGNGDPASTQIAADLLTRLHQAPGRELSFPRPSADLRARRTAVP